MNSKVKLRLPAIFLLGFLILVVEPKIYSKNKNLCGEVKTKISKLYKNLPNKDLIALSSICTNNKIYRDKEKLAFTITKWLEKKVHPSSLLLSDKSPSYWIYNTLNPFRKSDGLSYANFYWVKLGNQNYVRYLFSEVSKKNLSLKVGDRIESSEKVLNPVMKKPSQKYSYHYYRLPWKKKALSFPYSKKNFVESFEKYSLNSKKIILKDKRRIDYFHYFDLNSQNVNSLLTGFLLNPNPKSEVSLLDLRGPTGLLKSEISSILPTFKKEISKTIKNRSFYLLIDKETEGFKLILAGVLQELGGTLLGTVPGKLPTFMGFFPIGKGSLLLVPVDSKLYIKPKWLKPDNILEDSIAYGDGIDKLLEKSFEIITNSTF